MTNVLRRLFWMAALGGSGYAGWLFWQQRSTTDTDAAPEWPPLQPPTTPERVEPIVTADAREVPAPDGASSRWVPSDNGQCPTGYPIKANDNSKIFHRPGGRFYDRTVPERCYAEAEHAEADGYRASKT